MLTHNHGLLAYWFSEFLNRRLKTRIQPVYIIAGAVLPDIFLILDFLLPSKLLITVSKCLHSIPIFGIFLFGLLLIQKFRYGRVTSFFFGWGIFHIALDMVTHKNKAWPYFWPWLDYPIHGVADHSNPTLLVIEAVLTIYILHKIKILVARQATKKTP